MSLTTLRPNATVVNNAIIANAATAHAAVSDNLDTSYIATFDPTDNCEVNFADLTLAAGAVIKSATLRARCAKQSVDTSLRMVAHLGAGNSFGDGARTVNWIAPTTITINTLATASLLSDAGVDAATCEFWSNGLGTIRVHEIYLDVVTVAKPVCDPTAPTGTLTTTNLPTATWTNTLDTDGGPQTHYQARWFTAAQYGIGGFSPATSPATLDTGIVASGATSSQASAPLPDGTYRVYVRSAQTVNGVQHWSDYDFVQFTISVLLPAVPTFTATGNNPLGRVDLALDDNTGAATTDAFEVQRQAPDGAWGPIRQIQAGLITPVGGLATLWDYEMPNGPVTSYRARALHNYSGLYAVSAWVTDTGTFVSSSWWLKHPHFPNLNMTVRVRSFQQVHRAGRQGVFQPLGSANAIVVSDTRGPRTGAVILRLDTEAEQAALTALLDTVGTLMLQAPAGQGGPDYIRVGDHDRERVQDRASSARVFDTLQFTQVPSPPGDLVTTA